MMMKNLWIVELRRSLLLDTVCAGSSATIFRHSTKKEELTRHCADRYTLLLLVVARLTRRRNIVEERTSGGRQSKFTSLSLYLIMS